MKRIPKGTTFKILLPALYEQTRPSKQASTKSSWQGSGTILVVDDEEGVRRLVSRMLRKLGYSVLLASDGVQAIALFRERATEIDCVLLDLTMPHMDGEETYEALHLLQNDISIIVTSGYSEIESAKRFEGKGLAGFIQKPYRLPMLREKLRQVLDD